MHCDRETCRTLARVQGNAKLVAIREHEGPGQRSVYLAFDHQNQSAASFQVSAKLACVKDEMAKTSTVKLEHAGTLRLQRQRSKVFFLEKLPPRNADLREEVISNHTLFTFSSQA